MVAVMIMGLVVQSCQKEDGNVAVNAPELLNKFGEFTITKKIENNLLKSVLNYDSKRPTNIVRKNMDPAFDFENPSLVTIDGSPLRTVVVSEITNPNSNLKRKKSFIIDEYGRVVNSFMTEIGFVNKTKHEVKYFSENNELLNQYSVDVETSDIDFTSIEQLDNNPHFSLAKEDCGKQVIECMDEKYTGDGWNSVFLSIGSAFFPEAVVGVAVICIYESDDCK